MSWAKLAWAGGSLGLAALAVAPPGDAPFDLLSKFAASIAGPSGGQASASAEAEPPAPCLTPPPAPAPSGVFNAAAIPVVQADLLAAPQTALPFSEVEIATGLTYAYGIEAADYNCDGNWDISLFDSWSSGSPREPGAIGYISFSGNSPTQITTPDTWPGLVQTGLYLFERHKAIDINGDTHLDIVGAGNSNEAFIAYLNPGTGAPPALWERRYLHTASPGPINLVANDLDQDGLTDFVISMRINSSGIATGATGGLAWLKNPGPASSERWIKRTIGPSSDLMDPRNLQVADFDRDGRLDVLVVDATTGIASTYLQVAAGKWHRLRQNIRALHGHYGAAADTDGDGVPEVVQPVYHGLRLLRFLPAEKAWSVQELANFAFEEKPIVVADVALSDMDRDGSTDIVFSIMSLSPSTTEPRRGGIYMMREANGWQVETVVHRMSSIVELRLVDMNDDRTTDIVANAEYPENGLWIYYQSPIAP